MEKKQLSEQFEKRRDLYQQGLIARDEVAPVQQALLTSIRNIMDVKRWILEDDIAIAEVTLRDELFRLPRLARGGYSEGGALIRFNGGALWSLAEARPCRLVPLASHRRMTACVSTIVTRWMWRSIQTATKGAR